MTNETFDPFSSIVRIAKAAERTDARAAEVLALHFALEREMETVLSKLVVRSEKLSGVGFANKVKLLHAVWPSETGKADALFLLLSRFNELRNAFAHGDQDNITTCHLNLIDAYKKIDPIVENPIEYSLVAQGICLLMGDGPLPGELRLLAEGFKLIIQNFAEAFRPLKSLA